VAVAFVVILIALHFEKEKKDSNRFLLVLFVFDLFFCASEMYYGISHFREQEQSLAGSRNSTANCIATGPCRAVPCRAVAPSVRRPAARRGWRRWEAHP